MATIYTRAAKGSALTWTEGDANITNLNNAKIENVVEDLTPQLGGDLDVNGKQIVSVSNGNIVLAPNGTGQIVLDGQTWPAAAPATPNQYLQGSSTGVLAWTDRVDAKTIYETVKNVSGGSLSKGTPVYQVGVSGNTITVGAARADDVNKLAIGVLNETIADQAEGQMIVLGDIKGVDTSTFTAGDKVYLGATGGYTNVAPTSSTVARQFLGVVIRVDATQGSGYITGTLTEDQVKYNGSGFEFWDGDSWITLTSQARAAFSAGTNITIVDGVISSTASGGGVTVSDDTTTNATRYLVFEDATSGTVSTVNVASTKLTFNPSTGRLTATELTGSLRAYNEGAVYDLGTTSGTVAPDVANGNVQKITLNGNLTLNAFTNPVTGQSLTLIITQDATGGRTLTSSMKWANNGYKTLSTAANAVDIISVFYDGTNYWASLGKGYL